MSVKDLQIVNALSNTISSIGTGLSLFAFGMAVLLAIYAIRSRRKLSHIRDLPPSDRAKALQDQAEFFGIDLSKVPHKDKAQIVYEQLRIKANREKYYAIIAVIFGILATFVSALSILIGPEPISEVTGEDNTNSLITQNPPTDGISRPDPSTHQDNNIATPPGSSLDSRQEDLSIELQASARPKIRPSLTNTLQTRQNILQNFPIGKSTGGSKSDDGSEVLYSFETVSYNQESNSMIIEFSHEQTSTMGGGANLEKIVDYSATISVNISNIDEIFEFPHDNRYFYIQCKARPTECMHLTNLSGYCVLECEESEDFLPFYYGNNREFVGRLKTFLIAASTIN